MSMVIEQTVPQIQLIILSGRVDTFSAPDLRKDFLGFLNMNINHFVVDLSAATFIDSAGLAALVQLLKRSREANGDVRIILPKDENVRRIFRLTKFDQVFDVHLSVQSASLSFRGFNG